MVDWQFGSVEFLLCYLPYCILCGKQRVKGKLLGGMLMGGANRILYCLWIKDFVFFVFPLTDPLYNFFKSTDFKFETFFKFTDLKFRGCVYVIPEACIRSLVHNVHWFLLLFHLYSIEETIRCLLIHILILSSN